MKIILKKLLTRRNCYAKIVNCNIIANYVLFRLNIMAKNGAYYINKENWRVGGIAKKCSIAVQNIFEWSDCINDQHQRTQTGKNHQNELLKEQKHS